MEFEESLVLANLLKTYPDSSINTHLNSYNENPDVHFKPSRLYNCQSIRVFIILRVWADATNFH